MKEATAKLTDKENTTDVDYSLLEQYLLNNYQHDFPLSPQPFNEIAETLNIDPELVITTFKKLKNKGAISRIGPVIKPNTIGTSTLAALSVPEESLLEIADLVSSFPEVNHNYEREHEFNLWFVVTASNQDHLNSVLNKIAEKTDLPLLHLPLLDAYHIDLGFKLKWN